jgi:Transposase DDE domain
MLGLLLSAFRAPRQILSFLLRISSPSRPFSLWRMIHRRTVEHPFATIKYRIFGHPHLSMRGLSGAKVEIGLATMAYNLKRMTNVLGATKLTEALHQA